MDQGTFVLIKHMVLIDLKAKISWFKALKEVLSIFIVQEQNPLVNIKNQITMIVILNVCFFVFSVVNVEIKRYLLCFLSLFDKPFLSDGR